MQIKINEKILSIPPYISTTWSQIAALRMKGSLLSVILNDGESINISGLDNDQINSVFSLHASFLEKQPSPSAKNQNLSSFNQIGRESALFGDSATLSFMLGSIDGFSPIMQHDAAQGDAPDLSPEILKKIAQVLSQSVFCLDDIDIPKAEPHCNCFHCQIARAVKVIHDNESETVIQPNLEYDLDEEVKDEELNFEQWSIAQSGEKLYQVTNRLDAQEKYSVFLGKPVGCTCGTSDCDHIKAVLLS